MRPRHVVMLVLLILDVAALSLATVWMLGRHGVAVAAGTEAVATNPASAAGGVTHSATIARLTSDKDIALRDGPKFIVCGVADRQGNVWLGSEDQGVWCYGDFGWRHFETNDGLGDNGVCAVACDALGRIWVGHAAHGLSIYNGQQWHAYDCFSGIGGSHVFCIATCPTDGDVWIGTENGLARYSLRHDNWTQYDRETGMPANQASSMAFDSRGNLFVGMQCNGVAMAKAADGYQTWTSVVGPDDMPIVQTGAGLPSRLINAVLVTRDDTVYAGTCRGLASSSDHGRSWSYKRGRNWAPLARGRYDGVPADFHPTDTSPLREDWITALAKDDAGVLWVGYRDAGFEAFPDPKGPGSYYVGKGKVRAIIPVSGAGCVVATFGNGAIQCGTVYDGPASPPLAKVPSALDASAFPSPAKVNSGELATLLKAIQSLPAGRNGIDFLSDDWATVGNWEGRYGSETAMAVGYHTFLQQPGYLFDATTGPYAKGDMYSYCVDNISGPERVRGLLDPRDGKRLFSEYNDGSYRAEVHPATVEGPDLYIVLTVPVGVHRISLYFTNADGHEIGNVGSYANRDYSIEVKQVSLKQAVGGADELATDRPDGVEPWDAIAAELAPTLARTRVPSSWAGIYKQ